MQATLDVEFVAQTLGQFVNDGASKTQGEIYAVLDAGTDDKMKGGLRSGVAEMRAVLKSLREVTRSEFACFKPVKGVPAGK